MNSKDINRFARGLVPNRALTEALEPPAPFTVEDDDYNPVTFEVVQNERFRSLLIRHHDDDGVQISMAYDKREIAEKLPALLAWALEGQA